MKRFPTAESIKMCAQNDLFADLLAEIRVFDRFDKNFFAILIRQKVIRTC